MAQRRGKIEKKDVVRMGAIDTEAKAYLSDRKRFADAFNFSVYDGDEVIRADDLKELDTTAIALDVGYGR